MSYGMVLRENMEILSDYAWGEQSVPRELAFPVDDLCLLDVDVRGFVNLVVDHPERVRGVGDAVNQISVIRFDKTATESVMPTIKAVGETLQIYTNRMDKKDPKAAVPLTMIKIPEGRKFKVVLRAAGDDLVVLNTTDTQMEEKFRNTHVTILGKARVAANAEYLHVMAMDEGRLYVATYENSRDVRKGAVRLCGNSQMEITPYDRNDNPGEPLISKAVSGRLMGMACRI